jgi:hypothetical protein
MTEGYVSAVVRVWIKNSFESEGSNLGFIIRNIAGSV